MNDMTPITVKTVVNNTIEKVWLGWTGPEHITQWNQASPDWHCPQASNDLRTGGSFTTTMAAKDGSFSFEFGGTYSEVKTHELIAYAMEDGRKVNVRFNATPDGIEVVETFDPESMNPREMQEAGWQAILNSFKDYCEKL